MASITLTLEGEEGITDIGITLTAWRQPCKQQAAILSTGGCRASDTLNSMIFLFYRNHFE